MKHMVPGSLPAGSILDFVHRIRSLRFSRRFPRAYVFVAGSFHRLGLIPGTHLEPSDVEMSEDILCGT